MPKYDFKCTGCETVTEKIKPFGTEFIDCPKCKERADRMMSIGSVNVFYKGPGFTKNDHYN